jgi:hypothetical protein
MYIRKTEIATPTNGPAIAKSKRVLKFFGEDFRGVIQPKSPNCSEGTIVGAPILN